MGRPLGHIQQAVAPVLRPAINCRMQGLLPAPWRTGAAPQPMPSCRGVCNTSSYNAGVIMLGCTHVADACPHADMQVPLVTLCCVCYHTMIWQSKQVQHLLLHSHAIGLVRTKQYLIHTLAHHPTCTSTPHPAPPSLSLYGAAHR